MANLFLWLVGSYLLNVICWLSLQQLNSDLDNVLSKFQLDFRTYKMSRENYAKFYVVAMEEAYPLLSHS